MLSDRCPGRMSAPKKRRKSEGTTEIRRNDAKKIDTFFSFSPARSPSDCREISSKYRQIQSLRSSRRSGGLRASGARSAPKVFDYERARARAPNYDVEARAFIPQQPTRSLVVPSSARLGRAARGAEAHYVTPRAGLEGSTAAEAAARQHRCVRPDAHGCPLPVWSFFARTTTRFVKAWFPPAPAAAAASPPSVLAPAGPPPRQAARPLAEGRGARARARDLGRVG